MNTVCPGCNSTQVGRFRLDWDWGNSGDWEPVNNQEEYTLKQIEDFASGNRPDIHCYVCCKCNDIFQ